jgi:Ferritin-like
MTPTKTGTLHHLVSGFRGFRAKHGTEAWRHEDELAHLHAALDGAVTLEFATLPPYLAAIWSIKDELHPVAKSLREILQEEMLHMALACNMLVAIGGRPNLTGGAPVYPGHLPLDVHPELIVPIAGFSEAVLKGFLEIERPNHPGHHVALATARDLAKDDPTPTDGDVTIGEMYEQTRQSFHRLQPALSTEHQITGPLAWMVVRNLDEIDRAIGVIMRQGEGSDGPADTGADDLAHYYRFAEMLERRKLVYDATSGRFAFDTPIDFDFERDVWPMAPVPAGGYTDRVVADPEVRRLVRGFNLTYSKLLDLLQAAWVERGGQASFWHAIETMFALEQFAKPLLRIPRPDGAGNYGPDFRYIAPGDR